MKLVWTDDDGEQTEHISDLHLEVKIGEDLITRFDLVQMVLGIRAHGPDLLPPTTFADGKVMTVQIVSGNGS